MARREAKKQLRSEPEAEEPVGDWSPATLGSAIRSTRVGMGLSISELARRSDLSQSFFSQVEAGQSDISVGRLIRVAQALDVRLPDLLETEPGPAGRIVRTSERVEVPTRLKGLRIYLLSPSLDNKRTYTFGTLEVGSVAEPAFRLRGSESFVYMLEGAARIDLAGGEVVTLAAGDTISYLSDNFERMVNVHDGASSFLWLQALARRPVL